MLRSSGNFAIFIFFMICYAKHLHFFEHKVFLVRNIFIYRWLYFHEILINKALVRIALKEIAWLKWQRIECN